jgi:hypothetical protein
MVGAAGERALKYAPAQVSGWMIKAPGMIDRFEEEAMAEPVYVSEVRIERRAGPIREAYLPAEEQAVVYGVHGAVAEHYRVSPDDYPARATTLDHVVGAAGG